MTKYKKNSIHEGQDKMKRFKRLDQLFRSPQGYTIDEILCDKEMDNISDRTLKANIKEFKDKFNAEFDESLYRGKQKVWKYKDPSFSIMNQTAKDMEVISKAIDNLVLFKGDPRYDMLRFYLMSIEKGLANNGVDFMSFDNNSEAAGLEYIEPIADAILNHYPLKMWYKPFGKDEAEHHIHPYHLHQYNKRWYVFAYTEKEQEIYNYPLDRITRLEHLSKPYRPTDIDFEEYFDEIVGVTNHKEHECEEVVIKVSNKSINYIRTKPLHWTQKEVKELSTETETVLKLDVKVNTELKMLLFSYGDAIEILSPAWLRDNFAWRVAQMAEKYKV